MDENIKYKTSPLKAIREKCLDCCCGQANEVKLCTSQRCPIYPYRMGKNPFRTPRELTEEQRAAMSERAKKMQEKRKVENDRDNK